MPALDPRTIALRDALLALPSETLEVRARGGTRMYRGVSLYAYAVAAGLLTADDDDALASGYLVVGAADGARAAIALAEIAPAVSDRSVLLAVEQDGEPLRVGVRLVVPREGSRSLVGVVAIEARTADPSTPDVERATSTVQLRGLLQRPGAVDLDTAGDLVTVETVPGSSHGQPIGPRSYSGVPVHRLLGEAGMYFMTEGEELHSKVVVARAADGHVAVLAAGEFGPHNAERPAIAAVARDGAALGEREGPVRLIVPYDKLSARWAQHLVSFELREG
jgi:DMSO/TMAO reductase YedYZ molybdopterin-dependent catalytic subunit